MGVWESMKEKEKKKEKGGKGRGVEEVVGMSSVALNRNSIVWVFSIKLPPLRLHSISILPLPSPLLILPLNSNFKNRVYSHKEGPDLLSLRPFLLLFFFLWKGGDERGLIWWLIHPGWEKNKRGGKERNRKILYCLGSRRERLWGLEALFSWESWIVNDYASNGEKIA